MPKLNTSQLRHSNLPGECEQDLIQELGELRDNEFYMSAGIPTPVNRSRSERGLARIQRTVEQLNELKNKLPCEACQTEIERLMRLQKEAIQSIQAVIS